MGKTVKFLGHSLHRQLIAFPLGLFITAAAFDIICAVTGRLQWTQMAFYLIGAGIITGLAAALFGFLDWLGVPDNTRAKRIGAVHGLGNVVVVLLFLGSLLLRWPDPAAVPGLAYVLSYVAVALIFFTGW